MFRNLLLFGLVYLMGSFCNLDAASFDCTKAHTRQEKTICSNPQLNAADTQMGESYRAALKTFPLPGFVTATQKYFLLIYRDCDDPVEADPVEHCIQEVQERIAELALYQHAKVYSNAKGTFNPDDNIVFLVYSMEGKTFVKYFGDYMNNMNDPRSFPAGFVCDYEAEITNKGGQLVLDDETPDPAPIEISEEKLVLRRHVMCSPRTGIAEGVYSRVRAKARP